MNVTGDPIDERGPIKSSKRAPIHADPPVFTEQSTSAEILITGIKVVDLLAPYARGGKIGLFGGAGVGKTVFIQELIVRLYKSLTWVEGKADICPRTTLPRPTVVTLSSPALVRELARVTICTTKCRKLVSFSSMVTPRSPWCSDK